MGWLTRAYEVNVVTEPLWALLLLLAAVTVVLGPPLALSVLWARRFRRARAATAELQRLTDCLPTGVLVAAPGGQVLLVNGAARRLWPGLAPDRRLPAELARLLQPSGAVTGVVVGPLGTALAVRAHSLASPRGREVLLTLEDAGRRQEEAAFASTLVRQVSHELKTPLSVIRGHASRFAADGQADPAETRRAWAVVDDEATRLTALIDQAILMARLESPDPLFQRRPVNLRALCEEVVIDLAERVAWEGGELDLEAEEADFALLGDRGALRQMLLNLVDNALKYGGQGVRITLTLGWLPGAERIRLAVLDSGPGIPAADLPLVFEKGFRGSQARGSRAGSGFGLALVHSIAEWHGGTVSAESSPQGGTSIVVLLPRDSGGPAS